MRRAAPLAAAALLACGRGEAPAPVPEHFAMEPFGIVRLLRPEATPKRVVLLLADEHAAARLAPPLAADGALVVEVEPSHYLAALETSPAWCVYPAGDLLGLAQIVERRLAFEAHVAPVLVGSGTGAPLVFVALAEGAPDDFVGGVSLGFAPTLATQRRVCEGSGLVAAEPAPTAGVALSPAKALAAPWILLRGEADPAGAAADAFAAKSGVARVVTLPGVGADLAASDAAPGALREAVAGLGAARSPAPRPAPLADLPLVEVPAADPPSGAMAVIVTGDGGFAELDRALADAIAARGVPVVAFDSLQFLWQRRTPDELGDALTRVLHHYLAAWGKQRVLLVGYSRGADVLPFMVSRLPPDLRARILRVALLNPGLATDLEFHVSDWFTTGEAPGTLAVGPEAEKLAGLDVVCIQGGDEEESLCPALTPSLARRVVLPGGHHFDADYDVLAARVMEGADLGR